ncbi:hypothetical protein ACEN41_07265 [Campylobacter bilis]|uniref:hypothetical protein n=1 Tax=Campylobacter bilis TaxID=2691918 RepID=UPI003594393A
MKNSLSSKKIVLSLIAISFLNSYAIASYSGNTYINSEEDGTETISPGNDGLVFITRDGSVTANSRAIYFNSGDSDTFLFLNNGTIQGSNSKPSVEIGVNNSNGADIKFFFNGGNIGNNVSKYGVVVWGNNPSDRSNIEHFTNVGTISSNNGEAIYLGNADIGDFTNWGTITSNKKGMNIFGNIGYLTNIGTLTSDEEGIDLNSQGTIENLINFGLIETTNSANSPISIENEGIIHNLVNMGMIKADAGTAITIHNPSDMTNFINMGTIRGNNNKVINIRDAAIKNFVNAGTIDNDIDNDNTSIVGINIQGGTIKNFVNAGTIAASTGINLTGATIENFINKNIIEAKENGIIIGENAQINNIILENDSIIESGNDAIYLSNSSDMGFSDSIKVKNGAKIKGGNAAIHIDPQATVKTITIAGEVFGGTAGIVNEGNIGTSLEEELEEDGDNSTNNGNPKTRTRRSAIVVTGTGSVESSSGGSGILNTGDGSIDGDIEIKKGANLVPLSIPLLLLQALVVPYLLVVIQP